MDSVDIPKPILALEDKKIKKCAGGAYHSVCIDEEGMVWTSGSGEFGQLGHSNKENLSTPKMVEYLAENDIRARECDAGYARTAIITRQNELFLFGRNDDGQCGLEKQEGFEQKEDIATDEICILTPTKLSLHGNIISSIFKVSMGYKHTLVIYH